MKVILYIGHHKVGSTALQGYLSRNWLKLLKEGGILYPMVEARGMTNVLGRALLGMDDHTTLHINVREPHNALAFQMIDAAGGFKAPDYLEKPPAAFQMIRAIQEQVETLGPEVVVLCSEVMSNFGHQAPKLAGRLRSIFPEGTSFEIYMTLRRPDEYLASWYGQRMRFVNPGKRMYGVAEARRLSQTVHFDYIPALRPWQAAFPDATFHLRNYADVLAAGGSCEDFTAQVGVDFPDGLSPAPRANKSIPYAFIEIMRRARPGLNHDEAMELMHFLENTPVAGEVYPNAEVELFGQEARDFLAEAFAPIHDYIGALGGRAPFFPDIEEVKQVHPVEEEVASRDALERLLKLPPFSRPPKPAWNFLKNLGKEL